MLCSNAENVLEREAQGKLNLPGGRGGAVQPSRGRIARGRGPGPGEDGIGTSRTSLETGMIRQIERLRSKLKPPLAVQNELPLQGDVHVEYARRKDGVSSQITEDARRGRAEGAGVKV